MPLRLTLTPERRNSCVIPGCKDKSGEDRIRTEHQNAEKTSISLGSGAESGAVGTQNAPIDPDLQAINHRPITEGYVSEGVQELAPDKLTPLLRLKYNNSIADAVADLGRPEEIGTVFAGFQQYLYRGVA
jgi:hypothetical protein